MGRRRKVRYVLIGLLPWQRHSGTKSPQLNLQQDFNNTCAKFHIFIMKAVEKGGA